MLNDAPNEIGVPARGDVEHIVAAISGEPVQADAEYALTSGDALTWDAGSSYRIENRHHATCALLLNVAAQGEFPMMSAPPAAARAPIQLVPAPVAQGPLRLVAMRAQRRGKDR